MIVLAMISYAMPGLTNRPPGKHSPLGFWAFWLQVSGMFGMTLAFGTAGIGQVYLERIMGMGYLDAQLKIQVHFLMLILTATVFATGVALYIFDFFRYRPQFDVIADDAAGVEPGERRDPVAGG